MKAQLTENKAWEIIAKTFELSFKEKKFSLLSLHGLCWAVDEIRVRLMISEIQRESMFNKIRNERENLKIVSTYFWPCEPQFCANRAALARKFQDIT